MRPKANASQKTNITSLAAATGIIVFVAWMATFAAPPDSLYAPAPTSLSVEPATHERPVDARRGETPTPTPRVGQG